jgi:uncharacterized protein with von Willebrand factor type A (vWA) domain
MTTSIPKRTSFITSEQLVVQTCQLAIATVQQSVRALQTVALDVKDTVAEIERVLAAVDADSHPPEQVRILLLARQHGKAMMEQLEIIGAYDPVPIDML